MNRLAGFFFLFATLIFFNNKSFAQFDYWGGGIVLATGGEYKYDDLPYYNKSFGIDLRLNYDYSKKIKIVPDFKFYIPNKEELVLPGESSTVTVFVLNINAHYILNSRSRDNYRLYLLGGAHVGGWNIKDYHTENTGVVDVKTFRVVPGVNAGAGMLFPLGSQSFFFAEVKYVLANSRQLVFTPGLLFSL